MEADPLPEEPVQGASEADQQPTSDPSPMNWRTCIHLERWRAGDTAGFEALVEHFTPLLRRRARGMAAWAWLKQHCELDDLVQEIWAAVEPAAKEGFTDLGPGAFLAFLAKIADRTVVDLGRKAQAAKRGGGHAAGQLDTDCEGHAISRPGQSTPETPTSHASASDLQRQIAEELRPTEFEAWTMCVLSGYTADEAGLAMGLTGAAVRGLLFRSRVKLIRRFGGEAST